MRWQNREQSTNVEDRRGQRSVRGGGIPIRGKGGIVLVIVVLVAGYYGIDLTPLLGGGGMTSTVSEPYTPSPREQEMARFTSVALKTTEDAWGRIFRQSGKTYAPPRLVLYSGATETTCGYGQSAMGPFYCPNDQTVYIDLAFYQDMKNKLGGGGDFAQGYVIAHEVGHHVQHLLGINRKVRQEQQGASQRDANRLSVMLELQADCFAGVWGNAMKKEGILEAGDLEEALRTAQAIGDDRLQRQSSGRVVPDSFTHGTSKQRHTWFKRGFDSGNPNECNTFAGIN
ncbi:neutral zinc metallopeptidase [Desulfovibrio sp. OttesenSCG-928-O18]|nr:neutral zinc metallopeptidase [Desulfovibrio sp. OttesenSCG-928-O18]